MSALILFTSLIEPLSIGMDVFLLCHLYRREKVPEGEQEQPPSCLVGQVTLPEEWQRSDRLLLTPLRILMRNRSNVDVRAISRPTFREHLLKYTVMIRPLISHFILRAGKPQLGSEYPSQLALNYRYLGTNEARPPLFRTSESPPSNYSGL